MKKRIRKWAAALLAAAVWISGMPVPASAYVEEGSVISLGAELTAEERVAVLSNLGLTEDDLLRVRVITISSEEEHEYFGSYLPEEVIGSRSISSCVVSPATQGMGIVVCVDQENITYCTEEMYQNALATAGVSDVIVSVSSPTPASGTAALLGAAKACAEQDGMLIPAENLDGAVHEIVVTQQIAESVGDPSKTAQLIAAVKEIIAQEGISDEEEIGKVISQISEQLGITLSDTDRRLLIELMKKLSGIRIDPGSLEEQARSVYDELKQQGIDLSEFHFTEEDARGFLGFFGRLWDSFLRFLRELFG